MIEQDTPTKKEISSVGGESGKTLPEPTREEETGEASEPDAPTQSEENPGMSTILDGGFGTGVQHDAADE